MSTSPLAAASTIKDAPALIRLLLSSPAEGRAHWQRGRLEPVQGTVETDALADLVTLEVGTRADLDIYFEREDLSDTLAAHFEQPDAIWTEVLDSFFTLWRRHAFPVDLDTQFHRLEAREQQAAQVLAELQARLEATRA